MIQRLSLFDHTGADTRMVPANSKSQERLLTNTNFNCDNYCF